MKFHQTLLNQGPHRYFAGEVVATGPTMAESDEAAALNRANNLDSARRRELARDLESAAYLRGDFVLSSGARSQYYFDKYLFETKPGILRRVATSLAELLPPGTDRLAGAELGAVPLATALSLETGLPFVIVRKQPKGYSTGRQVEGEIYVDEKVVLLEDVVSTGTQAIRAAERLEDVGAKVIMIVAVIDRQQGAVDAINAAGYRFTSLFSRAELTVRQ